MPGRLPGVRAIAPPGCPGAVRHSFGPIHRPMRPARRPRVGPAAARVGRPRAARPIRPARLPRVGPARPPVSTAHRRRRSAPRRPRVGPAAARSGQRAARRANRARDWTGASICGANVQSGRRSPQVEPGNGAPVTSAARLSHPRSWARTGRRAGTGRRASTRRGARGSGRGAGGGGARAGGRGTGRWARHAARQFWLT